jgi:hypothetical protein
MILYAKIAAIVIALAIAYWQGYSTMRDKHLLFVAEVKALGDAQELANKHAVEISEVITEGIKDEYETRIASLRRQYANAGRVCDTRASSGQMPYVSKSANDTDGTPADPEFIGKCAETTAQLVALQKWVRKQSEANN